MVAAAWVMGDDRPMSSESHVPPKPAYRGQPPSQARLVERSEEIRDEHQTALSEVDRLARTQQDLGTGLSEDLSALEAQGYAVEALQTAGDAGLLDALVRRFTRRRTLLARRSATEALVERYEAVSTRLRRASAFTDELRLTALELQDEVQALHRELDTARHNATLAAERVLALEAALREVEQSGDPQRHRRIDTLQFELRQEGQALELFKAAEAMCAQHLDPARALRDTVQNLHEEMQAFVLAATGTVDAAGRRIQALGVAADAPLVVGELQQSLVELREAMTATEAYLAQTRDLIAHTLPDLSAQIAAESTVESLSLGAELQSLDRARTRASAERALREAAWNEVHELEDER